MQVTTGFDVHGQVVTTSVDESGQKGIWLRHHEMDIERQTGHAPDCFDHRRSNGQIGHKMPVHHVHMEHISPGGLNTLDLLRQPHKVSSKNGRGNFHHGILLSFPVGTSRASYLAVQDSGGDELHCLIGRSQATGVRAAFRRDEAQAVIDFGKGPLAHSSVQGLDE